MPDIATNPVEFALWLWREAKGAQWTAVAAGLLILIGYGVKRALPEMPKSFTPWALGLVAATGAVGKALLSKQPPDEAALAGFVTAIIAVGAHGMVVKPSQALWEIVAAWRAKRAAARPAVPAAPAGEPPPA